MSLVVECVVLMPPPFTGSVFQCAGVETHTDRGNARGGGIGRRTQVLSKHQAAWIALLFVTI